MVVAELYRHTVDDQPVWKLRAVGQGWAEGLDALARAYVGGSLAWRLSWWPWWTTCSLWWAVWLSSGAVHRVLVDGVQAVPLSWAELAEKGESTPPFEPIARWGGRVGAGRFWSWSPRWEAVAGRALVHLLVACQGRPVRVPGGLTADVFQRALDALLSAGAPERRAVLAGPGQPGPEAGGDILLVPVHPPTGQIWTPAGPGASAYPVPLPLGVWLWLVSPQPYLPVAVSGGIPQDVLRDDPLPPRPTRLFRADRGTFQHTLARLPAVRSPWMGTILENLTRDWSVELFWVIDSKGWWW